MSQTDAKKKWDVLKEHILNQIDEIDKETPWSASEPPCWLEMMDVQRIILKAKPTGVDS